MKRRIIAVIMSIVLAMGMFFINMPLSMAEEKIDSTKFFEGIDYQKSANIRVIIDGKQLVFDVNPQIVKGRTLVPMAAIFEAFGLTVTWDDATNTALGTTTGTAISFTIGSNKAIVNNEEKILDVPATIINGRTMIPLRFLSENMGYNVVWIGNSNLILLSKSDIIEWRYDGFESVAPYKEYEAKYINGIKTAETRYNGINHDVKFYTLYSADGRLVPNVPEFNIAHYGTGWYQQSPYAGKTYWIDTDKVSSAYGSKFYDLVSISPIDANTLKASAATGNYIKVKIEEHYFNLDTWKSMNASTNPELSYVQDEKLLDGQVINNYDTIFRVTINDNYSGLILFGDLLDSLLKPDTNEVYSILKSDPRTIFKWTDSNWNRLKGETPWIGMTKDMLLVQKLSKPDKTTKIETKFSVYELWVYQYDYLDSIYFFDNGVLTSMW